jgi:hypothetical protein
VRIEEGNSKLAELADLFVASPLVGVQIAAVRLRVTPQAIEAMLKELGGSLPRELTGRKRYRACVLSRPARHCQSAEDFR